MNSLLRFPFYASIRRAALEAHDFFGLDTSLMLVYGWLLPVHRPNPNPSKRKSIFSYGSSRAVGSDESTDKASGE